MTINLFFIISLSGTHSEIQKKKNILDSVEKVRDARSDTNEGNALIMPFAIILVVEMKICEIVPSHMILTQMVFYLLNN